MAASGSGEAERRREDDDDNGGPCGKCRQEAGLPRLKVTEGASSCQEFPQENEGPDQVGQQEQVQAEGCSAVGAEPVVCDTLELADAKRRCAQVLQPPSSWAARP